MKIKKLFRDIYMDRQLVWGFAKKDFIRRFAGSYFGMIWAFVQPLLTIVIYWAVFQFGFRSGDVGDIPYGVWFITGIIPWLFFSEAFATSSNSFIEYSYLVKKVVFNIDILPLVKVISSLFIHLFFCVLMILVYVFMGGKASFAWIQLLYYMFCGVVFSYAVGFIAATIMVFFRDLSQIISIIILFGMWSTPIAWQFETLGLPEKFYYILKLNPVYYFVDGYRDSLFTHIPFWYKPTWTIYFWIVTLGLLVIGAFLYNRMSEHFADVL